MYCKKCGREIDNNAEYCSYCGQSTKNQISIHIKNDWLVTLLLAIFLGGFGVHRFYVGKIKSGVAQLILTCTCFLIVPAIVVGIWVIVDIINILTRNFKTANGEDLI